MGNKEIDGKNRKKRWSEWERGLRLRQYFSNMFADTTQEGEKRVIGFCKKLLFLVLLVAELLILTQHVEGYVDEGNWIPLTVMSGVSLLLAATQALSLFVLKDGRYRTALRVMQIFAVCVFQIITDGAYPLFLYVLMLTQLYLDAQNGRFALGLLIGSLVLYALSYAAQIYLSYGGSLNLFAILRESLGALGAIVLHFFVVQFVLAFYRQYLQLNRTLVELDERKRELEKAYEVVAEVSALEERQRIAKEIHDTAGHSLTTVIMQTETAKRIVEENPSEAKLKIIAANLQAKNTLERLRESVHLLSGSTEGATLKMALESIVHESTDGTGIRIRSLIEDMVVSQEQNRLICNALKEGIANGFRHGGATAFWFELKSENGKIEFLLSDNGKGMENDALKLGYGLTSMQENAKKLGGEAQFFSEPDEGFEIRLTLPIEAEK